MELDTRSVGGRIGLELGRWKWVLECRMYIHVHVEAIPQLVEVVVDSFCNIETRIGSPDVR